IGPLAPPSAAAPPSSPAELPFDELQAPVTDARITTETAKVTRTTFMPAMLAHHASKDNSTSAEESRSRHEYGGTATRRDGKQLEQRVRRANPTARGFVTDVVII